MDVTQRDEEGGSSFARDTVSGPGTGSANSSRVYPYPFARTGLHYDPQRFTCIPPSDDTSSGIYHNYTVEQAEAYWEPFDPQLQLSGCFFIRKKPEDAEIKVSDLPIRQQRLFTQVGGSRTIEWSSLARGIKIHRGAAARRIKADQYDRLIPSRYLEKWKDMGDF